MWPGKATCACNRTRHATARGARRAASLLPPLSSFLPLLPLFFFPFPSSPSLNSCRDPISPRPSPGFSPHPIPPPPSPGSSPFGNGSSDPPFVSLRFVPPYASPSSSSSSPSRTTRHRSPLRLRRRQPRLSHHPLPCSPSLLCLSPSSTVVTPLPLPLHLLLHFRLRPSTPITKTEHRHRPFLCPLRRRSHPSPAIFSSSPPMLLWSPGSSVVTLSRHRPAPSLWLPPPPMASSVRCHRRCLSLLPLLHHCCHLSLYSFSIGRLHCSRHIADDHCLHLPSSLLRSLLLSLP